MLPYVLKYNSRNETVAKKLKILAKVINSLDFIESVKSINNTLNIPKSLKDVGISEEDFKNSFEILVENSLKGSTRVNPVKISEEQMKELLNCIYYGYTIK